MSVAARIIFISVLISLVDLIAHVRAFAKEKSGKKQSYEMIRKRMFPTSLEFPKKRKNIELPGKIKIFYSLPNSINMRFYGHQSLESSGHILNEGQRTNKLDIKKFAPFKHWSISRIYYPKSWWSWGIRFSPSLSLYSWKEPGKVILGHLTYDAKGIFHLPNALGTIFAAAGLGPMYVDGNIYSAQVDKKVIFSPRFQLGYYRFMDDNFFFQLKYKKYYLKDNVFQGEGFSINNIDIIGLYIGYYLSKI